MCLCDQDPLICFVHPSENVNATDEKESAPTDNADATDKTHRPSAVGPPCVAPALYVIEMMQHAFAYELTYISICISMHV